MEVTPDQVINGLLDEVKRLTIENVALKAALNQLTAAPEAPAADEVK
jgi:hypothetical protein